MTPEQANGKDITRVFFEFLPDAEHSRKMLASFLLHFIKNRGWTAYEFREEPRSFKTLREMVPTDSPAGIGVKRHIPLLREILASFPEGQVTLAAFDGAFAEGAGGAETAP